MAVENSLLILKPSSGSEFGYSKSHNSSLAGKIVTQAGNVKFSPAGGKSYGYINVPSGCVLLAAYMQEVSGNVGLRLGGFNQSSDTGYTAWVDWDINDYIFLHWIYAKL
ncbi:hypothetical protein [Blautia sp. An81]|uniref:hypothetical protein n=1 Tax=Blautia sp. An81 TaxID=1965659 RepID=UPI001178904C|nr:hypothetical protein [Blautia sp. An81]